MRDEVAEGDCGVDGRQGEVQALLHGTEGEALQTVGLEERALAVIALQEGDLPYPYLYGFLHEPLHARGVLGGRHGKV